MRPKIYFSREIRGVLGDSADAATIEINVSRAIQQCETLRSRFPEFEFICPHENEIVNVMHGLGLVKGDDIVTAECWMIANHGDIIGVVASGPIHPGTGCDKEFRAAHLAGKPVAFIDDVDEEGQEHIAAVFQEFLYGGDDREFDDGQAGES
jgi:hypothetical protein